MAFALHVYWFSLVFPRFKLLIPLNSFLCISNLCTSLRVCVWTCEYVGDKILFFICLFNPFRHNMHFLILFWGIYNQEAFPKTTNNSFLIPFNINAIIYITNQTFLRIMQLLIRYDEACQNFLLAAFFVVFYLFSVLSYHFTLLVVLYLLFSIIPFLL